MYRSTTLFPKSGLAQVVDSKTPTDYSIGVMDDFKADRKQDKEDRKEVEVLGIKTVGAFSESGNIKDTGRISQMQIDFRDWLKSDEAQALSTQELEMESMVRISALARAAFNSEQWGSVNKEFFKRLESTRGVDYDKAVKKMDKIWKGVDIEDRDPALLEEFYTELEYFDLNDWANYLTEDLEQKWLALDPEKNADGVVVSKKLGYYPQFNKQDENGKLSQQIDNMFLEKWKSNEAAAEWLKIEAKKLEGSGELDPYENAEEKVLLNYFGEQQKAIESEISIKTPSIYRKPKAVTDRAFTEVDYQTGIKALKGKSAQKLANLIKLQETIETFDVSINGNIVTVTYKRKPEGRKKPEPPISVSADLNDENDMRGFLDRLKKNIGDDAVSQLIEDGGNSSEVVTPETLTGKMGNVFKNKDEE